MWRRGIDTLKNITMQPREKVIKMFEDKEAKQAFYKTLKEDILGALWIGPLAILGMALMYIAITYFLGDTKLSFWEIFQEVSFGVYVFAGLAILWGVGDTLAKNRVTLSVNFTENHLFLEHYWLFFKSKSFIPYRAIQYIDIFSDQEIPSAIVHYQIKNGYTETFYTELVTLDFWRELGQKHQLILILSKDSADESQDEGLKWYLQDVTPDDENSKVSWRQFQHFVDQTPTITLIVKAEIENYSKLPDENAKNYLRARYKLELSPATYGYLDYDAGFVYAFVPSPKDFKFVKDMATSLQNSLSNN